MRLGGSLRLGIRKNSFDSQDSKTVEEVAQRGCEWLIPENIQGQVGQGSEQCGLVEDVRADRQGGQIRGPFQVLSYPNYIILQVYNSLTTFFI